MNTPNFLLNEQFESLSFEEKFNYFLEDLVPEDIREGFPIIYNIVKDLENKQIHKLSILFLVAHTEIAIKGDFDIKCFNKFYDQFIVNSNVDILELAQAYIDSGVHEIVAKKLLNNIGIFKSSVVGNFNKIVKSDFK